MAQLDALMRRAAGERKAAAEHVPSEEQEQIAIFTWAELQSKMYPELRKLYSIPNGGWRHQAVAGKLKAAGARPGRPDISLDLARGGYFGLRIELKRSKRKGVDNGRVSPEQAACIKDLNEDGYLATVCYGFDEAVAALKHYLSMQRT